MKGILNPDDDLRVAALGADGIIVSNHGGRQLDRAPAPLMAFRAVHEAVGDKVDVMLDGWISRGSHMVIAVCLGARFVFCGRPTLYGVAAGGSAGIKKALDIFRRELHMALAQIGCPRVSDLGLQSLLREKEAGFGPLPGSEDGNPTGGNRQNPAGVG